jgi:hypothetical protein
MKRVTLKVDYVSRNRAGTRRQEQFSVRICVAYSQFVLNAVSRAFLQQV